MSIIRFNLTTKEIEIEGPESFIDANFVMIQDIVTERPYVKKARIYRKKEEAPEHIFTEREESEIIEEIKAPELLKASEPGMAKVPDEMKPERPPVRKYILRKAGSAGTKDPIVSLTNEGARRVSLVSLKEKLGVNDQRIAGILKEAEKQGRVRRDIDG